MYKNTNLGIKKQNIGVKIMVTNKIGVKKCCKNWCKKIGVKKWCKNWCKKIGVKNWCQKMGVKKYPQVFNQKIFKKLTKTRSKPFSSKK